MITITIIIIIIIIIIIRCAMIIGQPEPGQKISLISSRASASATLELQKETKIQQSQA